MAAGPENRDRLLPFIGKSRFAQEIISEIESVGYAVLPGVFSGEEMDREYGRMWKWVETVSPGIKRNRLESWRRRGSGQDPWPCAQRDMMQLHQAGWVFNELREQMAERVFESLYGTQELHSSKDGFTLQRPTFEDVWKPANDHFDQGSGKLGLQCIQGSVALTDQEHDDGCFLCWPGSHKYHEQLMSRGYGKSGRHDFLILDDSEKAYLEAQGINPVRVNVKKGSVILFRSDLCHKGALPIGRRNNFRAVVYICMLPAVLTPEEVYPQKRLAYEQLESGSHWPCREEWFKLKRAPSFELRKYWNAPPTLSARQRLLYGLDRYQEAAAPARLLASNAFRNPDERASAYKSGAEGKENAGHLAIGNGKDELQKRRRWGKKDPISDGAGGRNAAELSQPCASASPLQMKATGDDQSMMSQPSKKNEMTTQICSDDMSELAKSSGLARASGSTAVEKEVRKIQKALREIDALEQWLKAGEKLLQNQQWKINKKATLLQRLCDLGVQVCVSTRAQ